MTPYLVAKQWKQLKWKEHSEKDFRGDTGGRLPLLGLANNLFCQVEPLWQGKTVWEDKRLRGIISSGLRSIKQDNKVNGMVFGVLRHGVLQVWWVSENELSHDELEAERAPTLMFLMNWLLIPSEGKTRVWKLCNLFTVLQYVSFTLRSYVS